MGGELRISRVHYPVTGALGPGDRLGIWVQGCPLACAGCMSRDTWDPGGGQVVRIADLVDCWRRAAAAGATGITVSGGEPLAQPEGLGELLRQAAAVRAGRELDFLVYSGYTWAELDERRRAAVAAADALITGRFDVTAPTGLIWRGSANQELIPRTELGWRRYRDFLDHVPDRPPLQVVPYAAGVQLIGVPRAGTLPDFERSLRGAGQTVDEVSWRPSRSERSADKT